jgi:hypothetical protein
VESSTLGLDDPDPNSRLGLHFSRLQRLVFTTLQAMKNIAHAFTRRLP